MSAQSQTRTGVHAGRHHEHGVADQAERRSSTYRPLSHEELAERFTTILGREIRLPTAPWRLTRVGMSLAGLLNPFLRDGPR